MAGMEAEYRAGTAAVSKQKMDHEHNPLMVLKNFTLLYGLLVVNSVHKHGRFRPRCIPARVDSVAVPGYDAVPQQRGYA